MSTEHTGVPSHEPEIAPGNAPSVAPDAAADSAAAAPDAAAPDAATDAAADAAAIAAAEPSRSNPTDAARRRPSPSSVIWLTLVWVLLWGEYTWGNLLGGLAVAFAVTFVLPLPRVPFAGRPSVLGLLRLFGRLAVDILVASIHVAALALRLGTQPRSGVLRVRLRSRSDLYLTLTADLCSLVPGSIIVEAHRSTSTLYVHVLDLEGPEGIDRARASVLAQEARVLYALASPQEIAAAGLTPRRLGGGPRHQPATGNADGSANGNADGSANPEGAR